MNIPYRTSREATQLAESLREQVPADAYPHLAEMVVEHALKPGYDYATEFVDCLDRLRRAA